MQCSEKQLFRLLSDDEVWQGITDDYCRDVPRDEAARNMLAAAPVLCPTEGVAFFLFPRSATLTDVHVAVAEGVRGKTAIAAAKEAMRHVFENTTFEKITSAAPADNKSLRMFVRACGFRREGVLTQSLRRDGQLTDQIIYSMEKERFLCQERQY